MSALTIHHLHTRLRLPEAQRDEAARLRRLLARLIDGALEPALEGAGIDDRGELCIRRIDLPPLRLDLAATDGYLVERWAHDWAAAIVRRIGRADAGIVRYPSRVQALIDLVVSASRGDFTRAWAWRQLGLWPEPTTPTALTTSDAAGLVVRALVAESRHAAVALAWLAATPPLFDRWLNRCSDDALLRLAQAVLAAAGGDPVVLEAARPTLKASGRSGWSGRDHRRRFDRAAIATALRRQPLAASARRTALAVLAIAECEPAWLRAPQAELRALMAALAALPPSPAAVPADDGAARPGQGAAQVDSVAAVSAREKPAAVADEQVAPAAARPSAGSAASGRRSGAQQTPAANRPPATPSEAPPTGLRQAAGTAFGGLLFMVNLAGPLGWPDRLLRDAVLAPRGLRWTLHQLACTLLPLAADDAAALAFAGLRPADRLPDDGEAAPDDAECAALACLRAELVDALRRRLRDVERDDESLLAFACRRRAEILADPGWIELHLSLDDVRTGIRAAGLDLDPGWLPWLGVVIRFVYD